MFTRLTLGTWTFHHPLNPHAAKLLPQTPVDLTVTLALAVLVCHLLSEARFKERCKYVSRSLIKFQLLGQCLRRLSITRKRVNNTVSVETINRATSQLIQSTYMDSPDNVMNTDQTRPFFTVAKHSDKIMP
jgi:hypothetical protein